MDSSSSSGSSKRPKASSRSNEIAHCLVDGCDADLSLCRDYHRRHKVCEVHSKTARVTIRGQEQRFCQQCSRFHSLGEFDEGKRSCRKRLDGHNRRRRKPQPETLSQNSSFLFPSQSSIPGATIISFGSQQLLPASAVPSMWSGIMKPENEMELYRHHQQQTICYNEKPELFLNFSSHSFKGFDHQPHFHGTSTTDPKFFSEGLNHRVANSESALSLLSLAPEATEEFTLNRTVRHESSFTNTRFSPVDQDNKPFDCLFHNGEGSSSGRSHKKCLSYGNRWGVPERCSSIDLFIPFLLML